MTTSLSLSRSGHSSPLGKSTAVVKSKVPEETKEALEREARSAGMSLSELLREILIARAHGIDVLRSLYEQRLSVVSSTGPERGQP